MLRPQSIAGWAPSTTRAQRRCSTLIWALRRPPRKGPRSQPCAAGLAAAAESIQPHDTTTTRLCSTSGDQGGCLIPVPVRPCPAASLGGTSGAGSPGREQLGEGEHGGGLPVPAPPTSALPSLTGNQRLIFSSPTV